MEPARHQEELKRIEDAYSERRKGKVGVSQITDKRYIDYLVEERDLLISKILSSSFDNFEKVQMIDIGAASGSNLAFFHELGIPWNGIWASELLSARVQAMRNKLPEQLHIEEGDACELPYTNKFDLVYFSTVFTSILNMDFKINLAQKALDMTKSGGLVVVYDFVYNNPRNANVKGVGRKEIKNLFSGFGHIAFHKTTLAPPIGKRIGSLYPAINAAFPFLRTHMVSVITKS
ncbi:methyltransferase domain-containing protein [Flavobacteriales bacterium AH-315-E23]|nr:methyltransferase domain-containing protein [Flavobacteriales bacterium AH-315-E23]